MMISTRPALARACQLARSGAFESLEALTAHLTAEGLDLAEIQARADVRRMLRSLIRQARAAAPAGAEPVASAP